ncbi:MAG: hypothetical protein V2B14_04540 [bacterium]
MKNLIKEYNIDLLKKYKNIIDKYKDDFINIKNENLILTTKGILISNTILSDFLQVN